DVDVLRALRSPLGVGVAHRHTGEWLRNIAVRPVELPPDAHVYAVVEVDRAPFVRPGARSSAGSPAAGISGKPLSVNVSRAAADILVPIAPAQRSTHCQAGLEIRVGVVLAEAGDLAVAGVRADGYRRTRRRDIQFQFHRLAGLIDAAQADPVGVGPQFAVVVTAGCPHPRPR